MNSTSVNDGPRVVCRHDSVILQRAIEIHKIRSLKTFRAAVNDLTNPAYKAIFKSNVHRVDIITRWYALLAFPLREGDERRPTFWCIYSKSEAEDLAPTVPTLWEFCSNPVSLGVKDVGEIVFICPPFFRSQDAYPEPRPQLCPHVNKNEFVESSGGNPFPPDKSSGITWTMLVYYGITMNTSYYPTSLIELYNEILRRNTAATANDFTSNNFFQNCGSIHEFHPALSSSRRNNLIMQQWCGTNAEISLMWTSHLGQTLQLLTQAWLETSPATVTAPTTIPETPRWPWMIHSLSTFLAHSCRGSPPMLSAHHRRIHIERLSASPSSNTKSSKYTNQRKKRERALPSMLLKQAPLYSLQPRFHCIPN